jgi:type IV pilus assembly protein PilV
MKLRYAGGFTMIEVLISIVVLAVGVIGAARIHLAALRTAQHSSQQTVAIQIASEMAGRIRRTTLQSDAMASVFLVDYRSEAGTPGASVNCFEVGCSQVDMAQFEMAQWKQRLKSSLPHARLKICHDNRPWNPASRELTWECAPGGTDRSSLVIKLGWAIKEPAPDEKGLHNSVSDFPPALALPVVGQMEMR